MFDYQHFHFYFHDNKYIIFPCGLFYLYVEKTYFLSFKFGIGNYDFAMTLFFEFTILNSESTSSCCMRYVGVVRGQPQFKLNKNSKKLLLIFIYFLLFIYFILINISINTVLIYIQF